MALSILNQESGLNHGHDTGYHRQDFEQHQEETPKLETSLPLINPNIHSWSAPYEVMNLKENEYVFREGESPRGLYFIKSGCVKMVVNRPFTRGRMTSPEFINKVVGAGEFFGFKALIKGANYSYFAKTLKPTEVHIFPRENITSIMNGPSSLLKTLLAQSVRDLEALETVSQLHYLASVQERIAYQLVMLSDKFGVPAADGTHLNLRLTRNELAQLAGTINESLSRHLTEFKAEGIIELSGKEIIIKNRHALMQKSGNFKF